MKKLLIIIMVFTMNINLHAQQFAGVSYGMPYDKCKIILDRRFKDWEDSYQPEKRHLSYNKVGFTGENFDFADFYFKQTMTGEYLYLAEFVLNYIKDEERPNVAKLLARHKLKELLAKYLEKKTDCHSMKIDDDLYVIVGNGEGQQFEKRIYFEIDENDTYLWLTVRYGPVKIAGEDDDI